MSASFELPEVERINLGTVGPPGQRTFYLQARQGTHLVTLKMEKQQVAALGELLSELLADLPGGASPEVPAGELEEPVLAEWAIGGMQLAYDPVAERIVALAEEVPAAEGEPGEGTNDGVARLAMTPVQAAGVVRRAEQLVGAGRPPCPLCGRPMDPDGHSCPKTNGHGPRH